MVARKPSEVLRRKIEKRTKEQLALVNDITPKSLQKTPSQKRSENFKKRKNNRVSNR